MAPNVIGPPPCKERRAREDKPRRPLRQPRPHPQTQVLPSLRGTPFAPSRRRLEAHRGSPIFRGDRGALQVPFLPKHLQALPFGAHGQEPEPEDGGPGGAHVRAGTVVLGGVPSAGGLGVGVSKMGVWRDAQEAGEALRESRPAGRARIVAADETVFKVKGEEVVVGFVVDGTSGKTSGFEVLRGRRAGLQGLAGALRRRAGGRSTRLRRQRLLLGSGRRVGLVSPAVRSPRKEVCRQQGRLDPGAGRKRVGRTRREARARKARR